MGFLDRQLVIGPQGMTKYEPNIAAIGEGINTATEAISGAIRGKRAKEYLNSTDAPDWMKALGSSLEDPAEAVKLYGSYKTSLEAEGRSAARADANAEKEDARKLKYLMTEKFLENGNKLEEIKALSVSRRAELEAQNEFMMKEIQLRGKVQSSEELNAYNAKLAANKQAMKEEANRFADSFENFGFAYGYTDKAKIKAIANGIRTSQNAGEYTTLLNSLKPVLSSPGGGGESVETFNAFFNTYGAKK